MLIIYLFYALEKTNYCYGCTLFFDCNLLINVYLGQCSIYSRTVYVVNKCIFSQQKERKETYVVQ